MAANRRGFIQSMLALPGIAALRGKGEAAAPDRRDVYGELGVRPLINAAGTMTMLGGSLMPPEVTAAMAAAARQFVNIQELQEVIGKKIAARLGCEAATVTCGAASALTVATAACMAGKDLEKIARLPDTTGMKNEVLIQKAHHNVFEHAVRNAGARLVEVETSGELERAVNRRTALMLFFNLADPLGKIKAAEFAQLGKKLGVPTLIDAAADIPPIENYTRFLKMGFDLAAFSGGKGLCGPQSTGMLLGRKDLVEAAALNNCPNSDSVGRTNKVGKEELVGVWTALELFLKRDPSADWKEWERRVRVIAELVGKVKGVEAKQFVPPIANHVPHLRITWDFAARGLTLQDVVKKLREGEPRVEVREPTDAIEVAVWMLQPGEDRIVGNRLRDILAKA